MSGSSDDGLDAWQDDQLGSGLTRIVGKQPSVHAIEEAWIRAVVLQFLSDVLAQLVRARAHLVDDLRTPVEQADDVGEVAAAQIVAAPATGEGLQLRGDQERRRDRGDSRPRR